MNRIDRRIQEVTALVDEGLQKHSLAHKSAIRIRELEECNRELLAALEAAHEHLDYCGYGDNWERECAREDKLEEKIIAAIEKAKG